MLDNIQDGSATADKGDNHERFDHDAFVNTGILERYVYGLATEQEVAAVENALNLSENVRAALLFTELVAEELAISDAVTPDPIIKPFLMATIDVQDRLRGGEVLNTTPMLSNESKPADFDSWLNRADMRAPEELDDIYAKIISVTAEAMTAIVWIREMAPQEVHHDQYERFLILEGTCNVIVEDKIYPLQPGNYFQIPLHKSHEVIVTSLIPCKVILQRVAA